MSFWNRHPKLERIKLSGCSRGKRWFSDDIPAGLLGNLIYFEADWKEVAKVISILPRLIRLGVQNAPGSDLLRLLQSYKPMGLPFLKSLQIEIIRHSGPGYRKELDNILKSIESHAPLLEEIGLQNNDLSGQEIFDILCHEDILSGLIWLERIYLSYPGGDSWDVTATKKIFFNGAFKLAQKGKFRRLQSITNISQPYSLPYPVAKLSKNEKGELLFLDAREGFGMVVGNHDHPFPGVLGSG
uniref:Uncharacterized protein n=1 Tax=Psilocybe cubensis TaxID=181762 RepID=A0A8H7XTV4_PSICU